MADKHRSTGRVRRQDRQPANIVSPAHEPKRRGARAAASTAPPWSELLAPLRIAGGRVPQTDARVLTAGALPAGLANQYRAQPGFLRHHIDYYEGDVAKQPAFRDRGGKLIAYQVDPTTVASLLAIARHRHWQDLQVTGDRPFRRAVWLEGARVGLNVAGYRPSARDRDAATILDPQPTVPVKAPSGRAAASVSTETKTRPGRDAGTAQTFQQGVAGWLVDYGQAPYQNQAGGKPTAFMRVDIGAAKPFEIWGVDLTKALQDAKIKLGDAVTLSWHGPDYGQIRVEKVKGASGMSRQNIEVGDRGHATPAPTPTPAQGRLAVVEAVARVKLDRPKDRAQIGAAAKAKLAEHLARGSDFILPRVAERSVRPSPDLGQTPSRPSSRERDR